MHLNLNNCNSLILFVFVDFSNKITYKLYPLLFVWNGYKNSNVLNREEQSPSPTRLFINTKRQKIIIKISCFLITVPSLMLERCQQPRICLPASKEMGLYGVCNHSLGPFANEPLEPLEDRSKKELS